MQLVVFFSKSESVSLSHTSNSVFEEQDFVDRDPEWLKNWGQHFGRLHIHPTSIQPKDHLEFHLVYKDDKQSFNHDTSDEFNSIKWREC